MSFLKRFFFFFLAIRIIFSNYIKQLYLKSNYYNNSLKSYTPDNFYFFPNAFLLSSFVNYKNFSIKLSDYDAKDFWNLKSSKKEKSDLHSYLWLNLIDRKNDSKIIREIIIEWITKNNKYNSFSWETSITCKRILSWIFNADIILNTASQEFKSRFIETIITQINHLKNNLKFEKDIGKKIEILSIVYLSGLVFKKYEYNYEFASKELQKIITYFFDTSGFPITRNSLDLIKYSKYFIIIKECTRAAQHVVPDFLDKIVKKNLSCFQELLTPNNKMPLFNGVTEIDLIDFKNYLLNFNLKSNFSLKNIGGIQIMKHKKDIIYFDLGKPPEKKFSSVYQSGPLSFEYFFDKEKVITNCGFGSSISKKAILISRLTSAQSTLCINNSSVVKFERNQLLNNVFGNSLKNTFKIYNKSFTENDNEINISAAHNAYAEKFGYLHEREVKINKVHNTISGIDKLTRKQNAMNISFDIRFHLYPGVDAARTIAGDGVLIKIKKNKSLIFKAKSLPLLVEKSIFLGKNSILNNLCIVISGKLTNEDKIINWEIKKNI